jgi:hypothetical protein
VCELALLLQGAVVDEQELVEQLGRRCLRHGIDRAGVLWGSAAALAGRAPNLEVELLAQGAAQALEES